MSEAGLRLLYLLEVSFNIEADGSSVIGENYPTVLYGIFSTEEAAFDWYEKHFDGDTSVHEDRVIYFNDIATLDSEWTAEE